MAEMTTTNIVTDKADVGLHPPQAPVIRRRGAQLTRDGMKAVIKEGGSFHWTQPDGSIRSISREQDIPSDSEIAVAYAAVERKGIADRRKALAQKEKASEAAGTMDVDKPTHDAERTQIDNDAAKVAAATAESEAEALANIQSQRAALDAQESKLKAAGAQRTAAKK